MHASFVVKYGNPSSLIVLYYTLLFSVCTVIAHSHLHTVGNNNVIAKHCIQPCYYQINPFQHQKQYSVQWAIQFFWLFLFSNGLKTQEGIGNRKASLLAEEMHHITSQHTYTHTHQNIYFLLLKKDIQKLICHMKRQAMLTITYSTLKFWIALKVILDLILYTYYTLCV